MFIERVTEKGKDIYQKLFSKKSKAIVLNINIQNKGVKIMTFDTKDYSSILISAKRYEFLDFSDDFYDLIINMVQDSEYYKNFKEETDLYITLPNECFTYDLIEIPTMKKYQMNDSLEIKKINSYKNKDQLLIRSNLLHSDKKISTYQVRLVRKEIIKELYSKFSDIGLCPKAITISANSLISGVSHLDSKMLNQSYLFLDIKDTYSTITICDNGHCNGYYYFGFGENILNTTSIVCEEALFNHTFSKEVILKSQAKAKGQNYLMENDAFNKYNERKVDGNGLDCIQENFKIFIKWLLLVQKSYNINEGDFSINNIYVNVPIKYHSIIENIANDNDIIIFSHNLGIAEEYLSNLELYGAIYPNKLTKPDYL